MKRILLFSLLIAVSWQALAQRPSLQFAQTHFGLSSQVSVSGHTYVLDRDDRLQKKSLPQFIQPRIDFGGLHFWGHADFYISVPLAQFSTGGPDSLEIGYGGIATGGHVYPWKLKKQKLLPYAGINWSVLHYGQSLSDKQGPDLVRHKVILEAGLTYVTKRARPLQAGLLYTPEARLDYPVSRDRSATTMLPPLAFKVGYKYILDFTRYTDTAYQERFYRLLRKRGAHSGLSIGLGLSSAFSLSKSEMPQWLQNPMPIVLLPDAALGYYFGRADAETRLSFRRMAGYQEAYGLKQAYSRNSLALEAIKFKGNYHGFVPFLGLGISHEWLRYSEADTETNSEIRGKKEKYAPVVIAGWDIRPSRAEVFVLRTNLRYTPQLSMDLPGRKIMLDQLEINFIQLVLFPQRIITHRNHKSEI